MNDASILRTPSATSTEAANSLSERVRSLRLPDRPATLSTGSWLPWILCLLFAISTGYFALEALAPIDDELLKQWSEERLGKLTPTALANTASAPPPGSSSPTSKDTGDIVLESKGFVIPISMIQVSPLVGGRVIKMTFTEGDIVKKGTLLAQIETTEYQADHDRSVGFLKAANARLDELTKYRDEEINQAKAELDDTKAQRDQLYLDLNRSVDLLKSRSLSPKEFEQADYSYRAMDNRTRKLQFSLDLLRKGPRDERIAAAHAEVEQYQAELDKNKWRLDNTHILSPIDGIILSKKTEENNYVNPSALSNGLSASICDMADLTRMEADLSVAERDIAKVEKGMRCVVKAEAYRDRPYQGIVSRIMPQADRSKGSVAVRVRVEIPSEEAGQFMRPDMGVIVTFYKQGK